MQFEGWRSAGSALLPVRLSMSIVQSMHSSVCWSRHRRAASSVLSVVCV